jgi:hypothetical protein
MRKTSWIIFWILLYVLAIILFENFFKEKYGDELSKYKFVEVPMDIKCFFKEKGCEDGDIDGWSAVLLIVSLLIGYNYPNKGLFYFILNIIIEFIKPTIGMNTRLIVNPLISITGYAIGSQIYNSNIQTVKY